jgi:periplasmic divalent cation tolerance protein
VTGAPGLGEGRPPSPLRLIWTTFPDSPTARAASARIVELGLAACATEMPAYSIYHWKGRLEQNAEVVVLYKTTPKKVGMLFEEIRRLHPYGVPEIVEVEAGRVYEPYLRWVLDVVDSEPEQAARAAGLATPEKKTPKRPARPRAPGASGPP